MAAGATVLRDAQDLLLARQVEMGGRSAARLDELEARELEVPEVLIQALRSAAKFGAFCSFCGVAGSFSGVVTVWSVPSANFTSSTVGGE